MTVAIHVFHDKLLQSVGIESVIRSRVRFPPVRYHCFPIKSVQTMHICSTWSEDVSVVLGLSSYHTDLKVTTLY